ncbi:probable transposase-like protein At4g04430 isoform X2 [Nicotiana sylvestris]|uniref:probable transposase-like protein At4g04430 isoform X2 n=1 Tax=Nicotiana sylvestris TaxID=4096 RepID=UPI00388CB6B2
MMSPPANMTPATSSSTVGNDDDEHRMWIKPEADGKFELAKPSWKKFSQSIRDMWFEEFRKKFKWLPQYNVATRDNFEKRAAARMTQLFQDIRKNLPVKPNWMGDDVFKEMKEYWESPEFKSKSEQNKKNCNSNDGASIHTCGCISHRVVIWKRMKEATGKEPSIAEFYFQTHHTKNEKCWVNEKAEAAYNNFERTKQELSASQSASTEVGDTNSASQLSEMDIWVQSVGGKKKGRVAGLGSLGRSVKALKHSTSSLPGQIDEMIKSQVHASNANLYAQLQEERRKNKKMRKELDLLKKYVNFNASSSNELSSQEDN